MDTKFITAPRNLLYLKLVGGVAAGLVFAGYVGFQARGLLSGPRLVVISPPDGATVAQPLTTVHGVASAVTALSLNDRPIHTTTEGEFSEALLLAPGYNVLRIEARDRFGRETVETLELIHKAPGEERGTTTLPSPAD